MTNAQVCDLSVVGHQASERIGIRLERFSHQHCLKAIGQPSRQTGPGDALSNASEIQLQLGLQACHACSIIAAETA